MNLSFLKGFKSKASDWLSEVESSRDESVLHCLRSLSVQDGGLGLFRLLHLLDALSRVGPVEKVISVGSGKGYHEALIARLIPGVSVTAVDIEPRELQVRPDNLQSITGDILDEGFARTLGTADLVYSIECLEHIEQDGPAFAAMARLVGPSRHLYLQVPFASAAERADPDLRRRELETYGHCTPGYDAAQLRELCTTNGLDVLDVKNVFWAPLQPMVWATVERFGAGFAHQHVADLLRLLQFDRKDALASDRSQCTGIKALARQRRAAG